MRSKLLLHPPTGAALKGILGNTLILKYGRFDSLSASDLNPVPEAFKRWMQTVTAFEGKFQLIVVLTTNDEEVLDVVKTNLPGAIQVIRPAAIPSLNDQAGARKYLQMRAKSDGVELNDAAFKLLADNSRLSAEITVEDTYRQWYREDILLRDFPQYRYQNQKWEKPDPQKRISDLVGMSEPKRVIETLIGRQITIINKINSGIPVNQPMMHMAFVGKPGTGKTEFAKRIADLFTAHDLVSEARIVSVTGTSIRQEHLTRARGGVLFIDEAYALMPREQFIAELISYMEANRKDTVVIFAGYRREIEELLSVNTGFRSRVAHIIIFPDYTPDEKLAIFELMVAQIDHVLDPEAQSAAREVFRRMGVPPDQGNGRFVRSLFDKALLAQELRLSDYHKRSDHTASKLIDAKGNATDHQAIEADHRLIIEDDIRNAVQALDTDGEQRQKDLSQLSLDDMIGLHNVKAEVEQYLTYHAHAKRRRNEGKRTESLPLHLVFKGNPGTGKTEVARLVGHALAYAGILSTGKFVHVSGYQILEPVFVAAAFDKAQGGVLFIDEAYSINQPAANAQAAIVSLLDHMEQYRDQLVVILAGYTKEIDELIATNPGFSSRVDTHVTFDDYSVSELLEIANMMTHRAGYAFSEAALEKMTNILDSLKSSHDFANARSVRNLLHAAYKKQALRLSKTREISDIIEDCDLEYPRVQTGRRIIGF